MLINSSNAQSDNQSSSLDASEQRLYEKFLEQGEEAFEKECLKSLNIDNEYAEDFLDYMPKDLSKDVCENRIGKFKNLTETGTETLVENQTSILAGEITYDTYNDNTNGFSLEYPSDWHISDSSKGLKVYKGTREFTVTIYDDPQISLIDTYDFGRIQFEIYNEDNKFKITEELAELNIDDEPALSFSYSYGSREIMATALIHGLILV
ncbi:MAG: hypothetical protein M3P28_10170 [Thermoproteota archaeon]|nr:hypothetical protein [Thermoproteota archaeon]